VKHSVRFVAAASVAWVGVAVWAMVTDSSIGEVAMLLAGMLLLAAIWLLLRATDVERRRWQHTLDAMQAGIVLYDADDRLVLTNAEFRSLYQLDDGRATRGMPFEELLRTRVLRGLVPEAAGREEAWIAERLAQHRSGEGRSFLREMADSRWRRITEQRLPDGSRLGFSIDITELVENQRALTAARHEAERAHQLLHDAVEAMPAAVEIYDRSDRLVLFNQRMLQLYPHMQGKTLLGETFETLVRAAVAGGKVPEALGREEQWLAERVKSRSQLRAPRLQQAPNGAWYQIYETPMPRGGVVTVRLDATETVQQRDALRAAHERAASEQAALEALSATDALTGLANRRRFDQRLADEVQRAHRHATPLALLMIDIDHFKLYNDRHGHPQGDTALQAVAAVLALQARRPGELVVRYGGEEFALLLPHADAATAIAVAERCESAMATLALPHGASPTAAHVTLSIGVAALDAVQRESAADLVRRADAALYAAKAAGRSRAVVDES
jgi:diguanylate cyclase (GGDEF)-like protein